MKYSIVQKLLEAQKNGKHRYHHKLTAEQKVNRWLDRYILALMEGKRRREDIGAYYGSPKQND